MRKQLILLIALLSAGILLTGCGDSQAPAGDGTAPPAADAKDHPAPPDDWSLPVLDAEGFAALRKQTAEDGTVLVVDCWATWCGSCVAMFPKLHEAMEARGDKVVLVSLSYDENADDGEDYIAKAEKFLINQHAWEHAYVADPASKDAIAESASEEWGGGALPAVFVFGTDGKLAYEMLETRGEVEDWVAEIAAAVDTAASK